MSVEPATDEQIKRWEPHCKEGHANISAEVGGALIARIRQQQDALELVEAGFGKVIFHLPLSSGTATGVIREICRKNLKAIAKLKEES